MFLSTLLVLAAVQAQEPPTVPTTVPGSSTPIDEEPIDYSEVVLVWPDRFARWRDTRWLVGMELVYPPVLALDLAENKGFRTPALQVAAVIACDDEHPMGKKRLEVRCTIEDIALRAMSVASYKTESGRERVQAVLEGLDAELTGASLQLQVNERGGIENVGLDGVDMRNTRNRLRNETLRQILARIVYPFHMRLSKGGMREGQWVEYDSELMTMPSKDVSQGSSMIVHYLNFYEGFLLVQDIGKGTVVIPAPPLPALSLANADRQPQTLPGLDELEAPDGADGPGGGAAASAGPEQIDLSFRRGFTIDLGYKLRMDGVSIYNIDNGVMEERVWSVRGEPNAQNPAVQDFWYAGKIRLLGDDDHPDLGATQQIAYPNVTIPGLPDWEPVDPSMQIDRGGQRGRARLK